ncbi:MAG: tRNA (cytidine(34)-2'-O)-methyltransferase [Pseudomonadota bacterium]
MVSLALYQPDQAGNCGTLLRLSACLSLQVHIIHPCGFTFSQSAFKRSAMDYAEHVSITEHNDFNAFMESTSDKRKILLTTKSKTSYVAFDYRTEDILLLGRESAGVPEEVHNIVSDKVIIPMAAHMRSLNMAVSAAMVLGEALRQTDHYRNLVL